MSFCLPGNKNLLQVDPMWRRLVKHYQERQCLFDPADRFFAKMNAEHQKEVEAYHGSKVKKEWHYRMQRVFEGQDQT